MKSTILSDQYDTIYFWWNKQKPYRVGEVCQFE